MRHRSQAVYVISVAAELAGMHPQTLRIYERRGLVNPARTQGGNRRYSDEDIEVLRRITELAAEGMNLEGIRRVMQLEAEVERLRAELAESRDAARQAVSRGRSAPAPRPRPAASGDGRVRRTTWVPPRRPLVGRRQSGAARVIAMITRPVGPGLNSATSPKPSSDIIVPASNRRRPPRVHSRSTAPRTITTSASRQSSSTYGRRSPGAIVTTRRENPPRASVAMAVGPGAAAVLIGPAEGPTPTFFHC